MNTSPSTRMFPFSQVRAKLQGKAAELAAAEAELARTREALAESLRREEATRALASNAQARPE